MCERRIFLDRLSLLEICRSYLHIHLLKMAALFAAHPLLYGALRRDLAALDKNRSIMAKMGIYIGGNSYNALDGSSVDLLTVTSGDGMMQERESPSQDSFLTRI